MWQRTVTDHMISHLTDLNHKPMDNYGIVRVRQSQTHTCTQAYPLLDLHGVTWTRVMPYRNSRIQELLSFRERMVIIHIIDNQEVNT